MTRRTRFASKPGVQMCSLGLAIVLMATSCSSGNPALEAATDSRFCQVLSAFPTESANVAPDQAANALAELRDALPASAPADVRDPLNAIAAMAQFTNQSDNEAGPSEEDRARLSEAIDQLERSNTDFFNGWLTGTCPAVVAARGGPIVFGAGSSGSGSSQTTRVEAAGAPDPVATATPAPTPTPTPIPVVTTVVSEDGQVGRFRDRQLTLEQVTLTNATYETFFGAAGEADNMQHVIVEMFTQSNAFGGEMPRDNFRLENPDGRSFSADEMFDVNGRTTSRIDVEERDSADFFVAFALPEPVESVDDWIMYYGSSDLIDEPFPLVGTITPPYPIVLDTPANPVEFIGRFSEFSCNDVFSIELLGITLDVEGQAQNLIRNAPDRRFVTAEVAIVNVPHEEQDDCRAPGNNQVWGYEWRLLADGVPQSYEASSYSSGQMAPDDRVQAFFRFDIPADVSDLELVDEEGNVVASWDVDIPPAPGEDGYEPR